MKPVARGPSSTCCLSHSAAAATRSTLSLSACCPSSGGSSSASVSQHSGRSQITTTSFLLDPLSWKEINVGLLRCVRPMDGYSGRLYIINALPLASVAKLAYKLWVFWYDPATPCLLERDERGHLWLWWGADCPASVGCCFTSKKLASACFISLFKNSKNFTCVWREETHILSPFVQQGQIQFFHGRVQPKCEMCHIQVNLHAHTHTKCIFEQHNSLKSGNVHTCQSTHLLVDRSKETDYIVGLVQSTSGLVFSLASLWWIRKECLVRFLLSLWCFQVIVHTSHPFTLVAPSGMPLTILSA